MSDRCVDSHASKWGLFSVRLSTQAHASSSQSFWLRPIQLTVMPPRPTVSEAQHVLIDKLRKPVHHPSYAENKVNAPGPQDPFEGALEPTLFVDGFEGQELPRKRILTQRHLDHFKHSKVYAEIVGMIQICNESVKSHKLDEPMVESPSIRAILQVIAHVNKLVDETPRDTDSAQMSRFGNPAFRELYQKIVDKTDALMQILPGLERAEHERSRKEVAVYFYEAWGNAKRIDYGSGMELNFLCWLLCLVKLGVLDLHRDAKCIVLRVFWAYIETMRVIQATYWLEPAGSHGVWGLDDYHFLPFLWGAGQLADHPYLRPKSIHDVEIVDECARSYMYFACIQAINTVKTESLRWHSPMLDDISGVRSWSKVNHGMVKMYRAEVLQKLPIAQHIFFGELLSFGHVDEDDYIVDVEEDDHGHRFATNELLSHSIHAHGHAPHGEGQAAGWGDCCGIPIPSVFAAAEQQAKESGQHPPGKHMPVRRIPFD